MIKLVVLFFFIVPNSHSQEKKALATTPTIINESVVFKQNKQRFTHTYKRVKKEIVQADKSKRHLLGKLYSINKKMKKMSKKRMKVVDKILTTRSHVKSLARNIIDLELKLKIQKKKLKKRIRALYMLSERGLMRVIFSATNSYDFDKNMRYLKILIDQDDLLIKNYRVTLNELSVKKKQIQKKVKKLLALKQMVENQESLLTKEQKEKSKLISKIKYKRKKFLKLIKKIKNKKELGKFANKNSHQILETSFFEKKGKLKRPIAGKLAHGYGLIQDDKFRFKVSHKGHFYESTPWSLVTSIHQGVVKFSGPLRGYGQTIILDHGDNYYTVYANNKKLKVKKGEKVKSQQTIAQVGHINNRTGLYFEIRHFSNAVNPELWLEANAKQPKGRL